MMHPDERVARRQDLMRRSQADSQSIITIGKLSIRLDTRTVEVDGGRIQITGSEYQMLELLALRKGSCVTRGAFMNYLYRRTDMPQPKILDVFICRLRRKLSGPADVDKCIETIWGRGYLLNDRINGAEAPIWAHRPTVARSGRRLGRLTACGRGRVRNRSSHRRHRSR